MSVGTNKRRVVVAMSGGVDSSLAAAMMVEQGFEVIGITMKTYDYEDIGGNDGRDSSCCSLDGINMARSVAAQFNFPHYVFDFSKKFRQEVIDEFISEYLAGRSPNPCVTCNRKIKWEHLIEKARSLDADFICTGHYARVRLDGTSGRYILSRGRDSAKDQSYALYRLTQESLSRTIFPLAEMTKQEVRELSGKYGLASANKPESYEICFVADNDYARLLKDSVPGLGDHVGDGSIILNGKVIGRHHGYPFYTIGQRKGLGISFEKPLYVKSIDPIRNSVEVDVEASLYSSSLEAEHVSLVKYDHFPEDETFKGKIRYKDGGADCTVKEIGDDRIEVHFLKPRRAVTPGQSVVIYEDDDVVGGGVISSTIQ